MVRIVLSVVISISLHAIAFLSADPRAPSGGGVFESVFSLPSKFATLFVSGHNFTSAMFPLVFSFFFYTVLIFIMLTSYQKIRARGIPK